MHKRKNDKETSFDVKKNKTERYNQSLLNACRYGNIDIVRELIKEHANVEAKNNEGWTPLIFACLNGHLDIVQELIKEHANVEVKDVRGWTPIVFACLGGYLDIVRELIKADANVEAIDEDGQTPLIFACINGNLNVVRELIKADANVEAKDNHEWTPLLVVCNNGNLDIVQALVKYASYKTLHNSQISHLKITSIHTEVAERRKMYREITANLFLGHRESMSVMSLFPHDMIREIIKSFRSIL